MRASNSLFAAGALMAAFPIVANVPYVLLIDRFGYDDILREPPLDVLRAFAAGGPELVLIWLAFAAAALSFVLIAGATADAAKTTERPLAGFVALAGVASALAQAIGLSRWVFVVPGLSRMAEDPTQQDLAIGLFTTLHQFAGVAIGEFIGQTLLVLWTAGLSWRVMQGGLGPRFLGWIGLAISAVWIVGQTELLATAIPGFPVIEAAPIAFMAWEAWLFALGAIWIVLGFRRRAA